MIANTPILFSYLFIGPVLDTFGRKWACVIAFLVIGVAFILVPITRTIFPGYMIERTLVALGTSIPMNIPLLPDYVDPSSMGLAGGFNQLSITLGFLMASSGMYYINGLVSDSDDKYIYFVLGSAICFFGLTMICGIKDVVGKDGVKFEHLDSVAVDHFSTLLT